MTEPVAPILDTSFLPVAPPNGGIGLKAQLPSVATPVSEVPASASSWDPSKEEVLKNKESSIIHNEIHGPVVRDIVKGVSPTATPEDRLKVAQHLNSKDFNVPSADQTRWGDLFNAIGKSDWSGVNSAWNGGQDTYQEGRDALGNKFWKVFNQRGELRRVEDANFKPLTPEKEAEVGGITTKGDISPSFGAQYRILGLNAQQVAQKQSEFFNQVLDSSIAASKNHGTITEAAQTIRNIAPQLYTASVDPSTRAFIAGIHDVGTGNTKNIQNALNIMKSSDKGNQSSNTINNSVAKDVGARLGLHYYENKGWTDANGTVVNINDIEKRVNDLMQSESSVENITARKEDLANKAQILFAKDQKKLDLINQYINANYQIALAQNNIEKAGGLPGITPTLPHAVMDSFYSGDIKAVHNLVYGRIAEKWSDFVEEKRAQLKPGHTPDTTSWIHEFNQDPEIKRIKKLAADEVININNKIPTTPTVDSPIVPGLVSNSSATTPVQTKTELSAPVIGETKPTKSNSSESSSESRKSKLRSLMGVK